MELWDLYTKDREPTGETHVRGEPLPEGRYHLVVHVWIMNRDGKYLISQRDASRPTFPLMYECVGGSVLKGETSMEGAIREVKEEIGVVLRPEQGELLCTQVRGEVNGRRFHDICDVWRFRYDGEADLDNATEKEVSNVSWRTVEEIRRLLEQGKLVDTLAYFFDEVHR